MLKRSKDINNGYEVFEKEMMRIVLKCEKGERRIEDSKRDGEVIK